MLSLSGFGILVASLEVRVLPLSWFGRILLSPPFISSGSSDRSSSIPIQVGRNISAR